MKQCGTCGKFLSVTGGLTCTTCSDMYHKQCIISNSKSTNSEHWQCPSCALPQQNNVVLTTSTSTGSDEFGDAVGPYEDQSFKNPNVTDATLRAIVKEMKHFGDIVKSLRTDIHEFRDELRSIRNDLNVVHAEVVVCQNSFKALSQRTEEVEQRLSALETAGNNSEHVERLEATIGQLKSDSNERDQQYLLSDIELVGVPEVTGENLRQIIHKVADKLKVSLDSNEVLDVYRVGALAVHNSEEDGVNATLPETPRSGVPRLVVVRCARRDVCNRLLTAARAHPLSSFDLELQQQKAPQNRIYINERLTRYNKQLFYKVKLEKKRLNWKYLWTKNGQILLRKSQGDKVFRIKCEQDIQP